MKKVFSLDDSSEELIPKGAKMSKNIGRDTPSAMNLKPSNKQTEPNPNWAFSSRLHHLHRPIEKYFSDKAEEQEKKEAEEKIEKQKEKSMEESLVKELEKIRELIQVEKNKIKFCFLCKRKFGNMAHLRSHEKYSELHKKNHLNQNKKTI